MLNPSSNLGVGEATLLIGVVTVISFAASWFATDVVHLRRRPYIGVLAVVTVAATAITAIATELPMSAFVTHHWAGGLAAGALAGALVGVGIHKLPATLPRSGRRLWAASVWEGGVYGAAEGILLSGLPVVIAWQAGEDAGWWWGSTWLASLGASAVVVAIHHFGYWDFRNRHVLEALGACVLLSVAFLVSGSAIAPVLGHVILHLAGLRRGVELPPRPRPLAAAASRA
jgi:hypothetical protein